MYNIIRIERCVYKYASATCYGIYMRCMLQTYVVYIYVYICMCVWYSLELKSMSVHMCIYIHTYMYR